MLGHVLMRTSASPSQIHKTRQTSNHRTGHVRPRSLALKKRDVLYMQKQLHQKVRYVMVI